MHTVMLIDDDYMTLIKLQKIFPWEKYSFKPIYSTINSADAISAMVKLNPDVIFTDISMCDFDGFDVIRHAQKRGLKALFVIISGYSNFDYAQKAIRHNVVDYMLKPVSEFDGEYILSKLKKIFDEKNPIAAPVPTSKFKISNVKFKRMLEFIDKNYMEQLALADIAQMFDLNISYCCQLFQKYFNCSYSSYITSLKMSKATEMLASDEMSISDIAAFLHYDYTYFFKSFKKYVGITPYLYRQNCQKRKNNVNEENRDEEEKD